MFDRSTFVVKFAVAACFAFLLVACSDQQQPSGPQSAAPTASVQRAPTIGNLTTDPTPTNQHVVLINGRVPADFATRVSNLGGEVVATYPDIGVAVVSDLSDAAAARLAKASFVSGIERDEMVQWVPRPEDFNFEVVEGPTAEAPSAQFSDQSGAFFFNVYQWNMRQIDANDAWVPTNAGGGTRVAILDTGTDPGQLDLIGKVDLGLSTSFVTSSPCGAADVADINDRHFHGTFVSGLVAGRGLGMASVAPAARIIAVKVLNCGGSGSFAWIIGGIVYAANVGADVINMSLGAYFPKNLPGGGALVAALNRATNYANSHGTLVVAAAGNNGADVQHDQNFVFVPAQSANVISVGATGPLAQTGFDQLAFYTNFGVSGVNLMAPGGNNQGVDIRDGILSACSRFAIPACAAGNFYLIGGNGTSFASPHVAGAAAVVKSQFPGASPSQLQHCLYKGADDLGQPGTDQQYSHGRLNVLGAAGC